MQFIHERIDVVARANGVHAIQIGTRAGERAWRATSSPDQLSISDRRAVPHDQFVLGGIDRGDLDAQPQFDVLIVPELRWTDHYTLKWFIARKILFRKGRALVRRFAVLTDYDDRAFETILPQGDGDLRSAMP